MAIDLSTGLLQQATYIPSPNCDEFPIDSTISLLVIHCISLPEGDYAGDDVMRFFTNTLDCHQGEEYTVLADLKVSAHLFIRRDGHIIQFVPLTKRAWHAGRSTFDGQQNCNDFSIGIELEGTVNDIYTEQQYVVLADITQELIKNYPKLTLQRIAGHADVAPERKTDPGNGFDWKKYFALVG